MTNTSAIQIESESEKSAQSTLISRNITVAHHRTSVRLEPEMWDALREICLRERSSVHDICTSVALQKNDLTSLTAAIRVYVMHYFRAASTEEGHNKAGHGFGLTLSMGFISRHYRPKVAMTKTSFA